MIVVVGAGAAGLTAAIFAARAGARVRLLERTPEGGKKILISGGGRCNVLPSELAPHRFVSDSPAHLVRHMLRSWPLSQQRAFFENDLRIPLSLEIESGKLFPRSNRARDVRDALVNHARGLDVNVHFNVSVEGIEPRGETWVVRTTDGPLDATKVVIATGGLSVPSTGSDGTGLRIAQSLAVQVNSVYPALTPLTAEPAVHAALSGVSLTTQLRAKSPERSAESTGGFLFTHRGYSGPAVLDVSHVAARSREAVIRVQWSDSARDEWERCFSHTAGTILNLLSAHLPQRLAARLIQEAGVPPDRRGSDLRRVERITLLDRVLGYELPWTGTEGFKKAEVTGGGVALEEVDHRTLQSRRHRGLFFCGEILDAFGPIGGHNFAWAWATGRLAGVAAGASPPSPASL